MVTYFIYIFHFVLNSKILLRSPFLPCSFLPLSPSFILFCLSDSEALNTWCVGGSCLLWPSHTLWEGAFLLNETALNKFQLPRCHLFCGLSVDSFHLFPGGFWLTFLCLIEDSTSRCLFQHWPCAWWLHRALWVSHAAMRALFPGIWVWTVFCYRG